MALCVSALNAVAQSARAELLWLGQLAFRLTTPDGKVFMIDPWLRQNPHTPAQYKDMEKLNKVDLILVTDGHFDHISDASALALMHKVDLFYSAKHLRLSYTSY